MNRSNTITTTLLAIPIVALALQAGERQDIPAHPDDLVFEPLVFSPPDSSEYRYELPGGIPVYMAPSSEFPSFAASGASSPEGRVVPRPIEGCLLCARARGRSLTRISCWPRCPTR